MGEQEWRSGEGTRLPPRWLMFDSRTRCHKWVAFVVHSPPCSERFFSGYSSFALSSKSNTYKFQFDLESVSVSTEEKLGTCFNWVVMTFSHNRRQTADASFQFAKSLTTSVLSSVLYLLFFLALHLLPDSRENLSHPAWIMKEWVMLLKQQQQLYYYYWMKKTLQK